MSKRKEILDEIKRRVDACTITIGTTTVEFASYIGYRASEIIGGRVVTFIEPESAEGNGINDDVSVDYVVKVGAFFTGSTVDQKIYHIVAIEDAILKALLDEQYLMNTSGQELCSYIRFISQEEIYDDTENNIAVLMRFGIGTII